MRHASLFLFIALDRPPACGADTSSQLAARRTLPVKTSLVIWARPHGSPCHLNAIDAESLTCVHGLTGASETFQRTAITSVKITHRDRSTALGLAIGTGAGAGIGTAVFKNDGFI